MKTVVLTGLRKMELRDVPIPKINQNNDVLLKIASVGICGSDVHYYINGRIGDQKVQYPFVVGHECSAIVAEVGPSVTNVKSGDHVVVDPMISCGECSQCGVGRFHTCLKPRFLGCPGQIEGCLSEFIIMPESCCFPIPDQMDLSLATFIEPLSIGIYACKLAGGINGKTIGVLGAGPIGLSVLLAAQMMDADFKYMTDKIENRCQYAKKLGAEWVGNPDKSNIAQEILDEIPDMLDIVFECCGDQDAVNQAVDLLKPGGKLMIIGIPESDFISLDINKNRRKELCLQNVRRQNNCVIPAVHFVGNNQEKLSGVITHKFQIEETKAAFELVSSYKDGVVKAVIEMD